MITIFKGNLGENEAVKYLKKNKYKILERNYRKRCGEIDIIAQKGDRIAFVEVKTRSKTEYGEPAEAVTYHKQQKIKKTALFYIGEKNIEADFAFDIIEVLINNKKIPSVNHIENAFY